MCVYVRAAACVRVCLCGVHVNLTICALGRCAGHCVGERTIAGATARGQLLTSFSTRCLSGMFSPNKTVLFFVRGSDFSCLSGFTVIAVGDYKYHSCGKLVVQH